MCTFHPDSLVMNVLHCLLYLIAVFVHTHIYTHIRIHTLFPELFESMMPYLILQCRLLRNKGILLIYSYINVLDCHHQVPQTLCLKQQKCIFSQFWRMESPRSSATKVRFLVKVLFPAWRWSFPYFVWCVFL